MASSHHNGQHGFRILKKKKNKTRELKSEL